MARYCNILSSDEDFDENLKLTERLRIKNENKVHVLKKKNLADDPSSSSSSLEINSDSHKPSTSRGCNKKRQNGDKNAELSANPKRTCLSNRFPRSECQKKKKSNPNYVQDIPDCAPDLNRKFIFADKTYEDHLHNFSDSRNSAFDSTKQYDKKSIFSNKSRLDEMVSSSIPEYNSQIETVKVGNSNGNVLNHLSWKQHPNNTKHSRTTKKGAVKPVSYGSSQRPEFYPNSTPMDYKLIHNIDSASEEDSKVVRNGKHIPHQNSELYQNSSAADYKVVDSASDEDSKVIIRNGSLKGGRQSPDLSRSFKKVAGRKIKKKVLDSDEDTDEDWLSSGNRTRPRIIFSSSDSEPEITIRKKVMKTPTSKNIVTSSTALGNSANEQSNKTASSKEFQRPVPRDSEGACSSSIPFPETGELSNAVRSPSRLADYLVSINPPDSSTDSFRHNRNPGSSNKGRSRVNIGERYPGRSGSPHPRTLPSSSLSNGPPRMARPESSKTSKRRSLTGSRARRTNMNLATTYPDIFDAENDSSEVEFFTANSYSDTETSTESFGGLRINTTVINPENNIVCEHSINMGSSEDEISVVFSTHRGRRGTMGRRRQRGTWRPFPDNSPEVVSLSPDPVEQVRQVEDDERFARMLQAEFDAEVDPTYTPSHPPPIIYPPGAYPHPTTRAPISTANNDFPSFLNFPTISIFDPEFSRRSRTNPFLTSSSSSGSSATYNNRRMARNRRRQDSRNILARYIESNLLGFGDLLSSDDSYEAFLGLAELTGDVPHGLQQKDIDRLPTRKYVPLNGESSSQDLPHKRAGLNKECQVCLSDYVSGDTLRILPCFHEFHTPCIDPWLQINHTCPVCRVTVDLYS